MKTPKPTPKQLAVLNLFRTDEYIVPTTEMKWDDVLRLASMGLIAEKEVPNGPNVYRRKTQKEIIEALQKY